jgi:hypothetical protein
MKSRRGLHLAAIWTISLWPALNFLGSNWDKIAQRSWRGLSGVLLITLVFGATGHLLERRVERRGHDGAMCLPWLAVICLLFSYGPIAHFWLVMFEDSTSWIGPTLIWWGLAAAALVVSIVLRKSRKAIAIATAFSIASGSMAFARLVIVIFNAHVAGELQVATLAPVANKPPRIAGLNVYYVLLDAYAGRYGLTQAAGFDNGDFYDKMAARGFQDISTEKSNYLRTTLSLGGIFNLDYPKTDDPRSAADATRQYPQLFDGERVPPLLARLNAAGYTTFHSATTWGGCAHRYLVCLGAPFVLDTDYMLKSFLEPTPFKQQIDILGEETNDSIRSVATRLPLLLAKSQPFFIFAHDLVTHPPFMRGAGCQRNDKAGEAMATWDDDRRSAYAGAVQCANSRALSMVDQILSRDPNALIVLQGDHGSAFGIDWDRPAREWPIEALRERRSFLNLVRAPADCRQWLSHPLGQINTARFVVACVEGRAPQYLPERGYMPDDTASHETGIMAAQPDF